MRVLYVEDDPRDADLTVRTLRKTAPHVRPEAVSTIREAHERLTRLASDPLDLVLMDMHLRDGDGLDLLQHIRENGLPLAVVLVTGMGDEETAVAALKARADDYVVKHRDYLQRLPVVLESALNHYRADAARRARTLNVLYAEDQPGDVESTRRYLAVHAEHIHLDVVFTGPDALSALLSPDGAARHDILLMSFDLPGLNALEVLRELRLTRRRDVPAVILCREGEEELARQALKLGAATYLVKRPGYLYGVSWELDEAHARADLARREAALRASEERNRAILQAIPDLMFLQSRDGTFLDYHATEPGLLFVPPEQFLGRNVTEVMPPQLADEFLRCFEQALATGRPVLHEYTLPMPDGTRAYETSIVRCDGDKVLSIVRDVTERKRAESELAESHRRASEILESIGDAFYSLDRDFNFTYVNREAERLWGLRREDLLGKNFLQVFPQAVGTPSYRRIMRAVEEGRMVSYEAISPIIKRWVETSVYPTDAGLSIYFREITERKRAEEAIRRSEAVLAQAGQMANLGAWEVELSPEDEPEEGAHFWSDQVYRIFGYEPGAVVATRDLFFRHVHRDDRRPIEGAVRAAIAGRKPYSMEYRIKRADGVERVVHGHALIDVDEAGRPRRVIGAMQDITERKEAEESLRNALEEVRELKDRLQEENIYLQEEVRVARNFGEIIGDSPALKKVLLKAEQVSPTDTTVLILGETGTGKELLAHAVHNLSPRNKRPLVKVNCAALPAPLIESELFGHERGAFTGAVAQRRGRFELADGGTVFLDEVGEMPLDLQAKLLRVLEEGEFERVGGTRTLSVDVRVIAATNRDLAEAVRKGTFRSDLYYRLNIYPVTLPPLRERREDIPALVSHLVKQLSSKIGKEIETIPQNVMSALTTYDWPGNVRELRNVIERAVIITRGASLRLTDAVGPPPPGQGPAPPGTPSGPGPNQFAAVETLEQSEHNLILRALKLVNWKIDGPGGAAQLLDIHPSTLRTRMKKLGITRQ